MSAEQRRVAEAAARAALRDALVAAGGEPEDVKGTGEEWRVRFGTGKERAQVTAWRTGTVRADGRGDAFLTARAVLLGDDAPRAHDDVPPPAAPPAGDPLPDRPPGAWIGTDESGKGDYFGPLVSAAVLVDDEVAAALSALGVRDSKRIADGRIRRLAPEVAAAAGGRVKLTPLPPKAYNRLYAQFRAEGKSLNALLAWGHARSIEDLLASGAEPAYAIVDQFADAGVIERGLLAGTRERALQIFQFPRAEADIAVAAASILARDAFLAWMDRAEAELGFRLPKGASAQVVDAGRRIVRERGEAALGDYAKLGFRTTQQVLRSAG